MRLCPRVSIFVVIVAIIATGSARPAPAQGENPPTPQDLEFFENRIRPVLVAHCYECHSADSKILRGGLQLDNREASRKGGETGPAVVPGKPDESLLLLAIKHQSLAMPPNKKLSEAIVADFEEWIRRGAADPRESVNSSRLKPVDWEAAKSHWAFQPIGNPAVPIVENAAWANSPIDLFVLRPLQQRSMEPAPRADKRTLLRRVTFDLTGLPPTLEEIDAFLRDNSAESYSKVVDRLLASPRYGERWGRHWLDLVRYATSNGADENHALPNAWRYRDWVVRMINEDLPLDQFIVQQLAGDLLPAPQDEQQAGDLLTATGMLVIGPKMLAEQDKEKMLIDMVDEQIDTVSRTMLGMTVSCARCHDHKFDPIAARDYYALAGIFSSTKSMANRDFVSKWMERPLPSRSITSLRAEHQLKIDAAKAEIAKLASPADDEAIKQKKAALEQLEKAMPPFEMAMAVEEAAPQNLPIHLRGNHLKPGSEKIPRGMPSILTGVAPSPEITENSSGRLELAQWLVSPQNPLTARVMMNRVWMWHFGQPLMRSPSNWGLQAEAPSHPELLDWLSGELIRSGWSLKAMHRMILLSSTYQMSSQTHSGYAEIDPENRFLSRQNRRRLEAEPLRDSILFVGGLLDSSMGKMASNVDAKRRAIYLPVDRAAFYEMFSTFDYVETANHMERRPVTTVPNQALFLMNSPLVHESARSLVETLATNDPSVPLDQVGQVVSELFQRLYARPATEAETARAIRFLTQSEQSLANIVDPRERRTQVWATLARTLMAGNEFIYVE